MSHTVKMDIEIKERDCFTAALQAAGATILGEGTHRLFETSETGLGFKLKGWHYPLVLTNDGLKFDDYNGAWGNRADLEAITGEYALQVAAKAATQQGWYHERQGAQLVIYHPDGGTISVGANGTVDAACFEGRNCAEATAPIEQALGRSAETTIKPEMMMERVRINERE